MCRVVTRIRIDRFPALYKRELLKSKITVDSTQTGATGSQVLIQEQARAVHSPVVVQLNGLLKIMQCLNRAVQGLFSNRIVKPGSGVIGIQFLGESKLIV